MITPQKAQDAYRAALSALRESALTPGMPAAERMMISDEIDRLTLEYLDQIQAEISALTSQYTDFIRSMTGVVESLRGGATPATVLNRLTAIVTRGAELIGAATAPAGAARAMGRTRGGRAAARPRRAVRRAQKKL